MATSYKDSGVHIEDGNQLVERIKPLLAKHQNQDDLAGFGGFAALSRVPAHYKQPILVTATDGVGTKLELLIENDRLHSVGQDLVAMSANDVLVCGGKPTLFLDYLATGVLDVDQTERVISGIAAACELAGCSLVGGETAEHPGFFPKGRFDLAGFCVGWVEEENILHANRVHEGNVILGLGSSGPHSNGYSLIRKLLRENPAPSDSVIQALLTPTRIYSESVFPACEMLLAMAHITGGGFRDNIPRSIPDHLSAIIDLTSWERPPEFDWIQSVSSLDDLEMLTTFNCGIGMILFLAEVNLPHVVTFLSNQGEKVHVLGRVERSPTQLKPNQLEVSKSEFRLG